VFEELLANHLNLLLLRRKIQSETAVPLPANSQLQKDFLARLSFKLTNAQVGAYAEIAADMAKAVPMLRLLHSEVRAGKTVVAALAILVVVAEGKQAVVLAPTAELAEQYFSNFNEWFAPLGISLCLFTGEEVESERREHLVAIANGKMPVVIGIGARKHPSDTSRLFLNMK
jgi:ATP-dependent DNA helicase RecG